MTDGRRFALIIANNEYEENELKKLDAPASDAEELEKVLKDPEIGSFEVKKLSNEPWQNLRVEIDTFFAERHRDDLLFVYFACHGIKDEDGRLYFATANTYRRNLNVSGIGADFVNEVMFRCRSKRQVLLLDCCYGGAFARGLTPRATKEVDTKEHFQKGRGKIVITASDAMQFAFEEQKLVEKGQIGSIFTRALVDGLKTGEADRDKDGQISENELYEYIYDRVIDEKPSQTPRKWVFDVEGEIVIAKNKNRGGGELIDTKFLLKLLQDSKIEEFNKLRTKLDIPLYFCRADLSGKNLTGADLHEVDLTETRLINAKLRSANLKGTRLRGADLSGADLRSVDLFGANLTQANLTKADLRSADLKGMVNFTGANLTEADLRGADLKGMVNFENTVLQDADFTGAFIDNKMINFNGADIRNTKGLPSLHESNEYLEALKSFSEAIYRQFKSHNISSEQLKPIEESIKELVKAVEDIKEPEKINLERKIGLRQKFIDMIQKVIHPLPKPAEEIQRTFINLSPFSKLIGDDVQQLVEEAIKKDSERKLNDAVEWHNKGLSLNNLGRHNEAITCYDKALEINPNYINAWGNKGNSLCYLKRYDEGITCYDKALEIDPNNADAWYNKGNSLYYLKRYDEAIEAFDRAIQTNPNFVKAWLNKGFSLKKLGKKKDAKECFNISRRLHK
jgi:tetratricopeptide (TPR) repeat protein